jgi:uncharacterized membrane protein YgcG
MQQPPSTISERLRAIRRRVTVGVLATFVAAWLAVAALGKTGKSNASASADPTTTPQSTVDPYSQTYGDGGGDDGFYDNGSGQQGFDDGGQQSGGGSSQQQPGNGANSPGPATTQQS